MKQSYSTNLNLFRTDIGLLIFRVGISGLMLTHGYPKLLKFFGSEEIQFADPIGLGEVTTFGLAVFAEFICAVLVILGLGTRLAVLPIIATMAVAGLIVHMPDGFQRQELPLLFMLGYILLFFTGAGKYSLDYFFMLKNKK
ncbi:DoxX family protein [Salegentibacter sp. HM20]